MQLTEDAKALIQQEVNGYTKKYQDTLEALVKEYQEEIRDLNTTKSEYKNALMELNVDKWVIRFIFALVIGGTIWGLLKYQDVIDNRIALHVTKMDRLPTAISLGEIGNWRAALTHLDNIKDDFKKTEFKPTQEFKNAFYPTYLWVLSQVEATEPDGAWVGEDQWRRLNEEPDFIAFKTSGQWESDEAVINYLAFCTLKYEKQNNVLQIARGYFQRAYSVAKPKQKKAPHLFALAMIDIIENKFPTAIERVKEAEDLNPFSYKRDDLWVYRNSFMNSTEFEIWEQACRKSNAGDFRQKYEEFVAQFAPGNTKT
jgi:hypothetical protein